MWDNDDIKEGTEYCPKCGFLLMVLFELFEIVEFLPIEGIRVKN